MPLKKYGRGIEKVNYLKYRQKKERKIEGGSKEHYGSFKRL